MMSRWTIEHKYDCKISEDKYEMIRAGIELGYLTEDDIAYIVDPHTSEIAATNRLIMRRRMAK